MLRKSGLACLVFFAFSAICVAQEPPYAQLAPAEASVFLVADQPVHFLERWLTEDVWQLVEESPQFRQFRRGREYAQLRAAVAYVESRLEKSWREILRSLAGRGGCVFLTRLDPPQGAVILRGDDPALVAQVDELIRELASDNGARRLRSHAVGDTKVWELNAEAVYFVRGADIVFASSLDVAKDILARYADSALPGSLANDGVFRAARDSLKSVPGGSEGDAVRLWLFVRGDVIRSIPDLQELFVDRYPDAGVPLFLGVAPYLLKKAPYVSLALWERGNGLSLTGQIPRTESTLPEELAWLHSPEAGKEAAEPLRPPGTVLSVSFYRDFKGLWDVKDKLIQKDGLQGFTNIETEVAPLLFGNKDFATEVLAELDPRIRLVVQVPQTEGTGSIVIPGVAYVQRIKDPSRFGQDLVISFQTIVGLINVGLAQNGQPRLLLSTEQYRDATLHVARYPETAEVDSVPPQYELLRQISPTLTICKNYAVISSNVATARAVVDYLLDDPRADDTTPHNEIIELDMRQLLRLIELNREALIDARISQAGVDPDQAEREVETLARILQLIEGARYLRGLNAQGMYIRVDVNSSDSN